MTIIGDHMRYTVPFIIQLFLSAGLFAQPAFDPVAEFNSFRTAPHLREMLKRYQRHQPAPLEAGKEKMLSEYMKGMTAYQLQDGSPRKGVVVLFCSTADSVVHMTQYTIKPPQFEQYGETYWNEISRLLGEPTAESTLPMLGKRKVWERGNVTIQLILFDSAAKAVTLSYQWKR